MNLKEFFRFINYYLVLCNLKSTSRLHSLKIIPSHLYLVFFQYWIIQHPFLIIICLLPCNIQSIFCFWCYFFQVHSQYRVSYFCKRNQYIEFQWLDPFLIQIRISHHQTINLCILIPINDQLIYLNLISNHLWTVRNKRGHHSWIHLVLKAYYS